MLAFRLTLPASPFRARILVCTRIGERQESLMRALDLRAAAASPTIRGMRVFISWSGARSRLVAATLREWLPLVLHYVDPWMSEVDITAGGRWALEVGRELEASNFGIICLTPENLAAPWILFEAGALSKTVDKSNVVPYLVDVEFAQVDGPLSQFQAKKSDKESTEKIVRTINSSSAVRIDEGRLVALFELAWPKLEQRLTTAQTIRDHATPVKRHQTEVLEDLVATIRGLDQRLEGIENRDTVPRAGEALSESGFVTVDTQPLLGERGRVMVFECHRYSRLAPFLDKLWRLLDDEEGRVPANTFGDGWALREKSTGRVFSKMGRAWAIKRGEGRDDRTLHEVGISAGSQFDAILLRVATSTESTNDHLLDDVSQQSIE